MTELHDWAHQERFPMLAFNTLDIYSFVMWPNYFTTNFVIILLNSCIIITIIISCKTLSYTKCHIGPKKPQIEGHNTRYNMG